MITPQPSDVQTLKTAPDFPAQIAALEKRIASLEAAGKADAGNAMSVIEAWWQHLSKSFPHLPNPTPATPVEKQG